MSLTLKEEACPAALSFKMKKVSMSSQETDVGRTPPLFSGTVA